MPAAEVTVTVMERERERSRAPVSGPLINKAESALGVVSGPHWNRLRELWGPHQLLLYHCMALSLLTRGLTYIGPPTDFLCLPLASRLFLI